MLTLGVLTVGDALAILAAPAIGGTWAAAVAVAVGVARALPIDDVVKEAERAAIFGTFALVPPSILAFLFALIFLQ